MIYVWKFINNAWAFRMYIILFCPCLIPYWQYVLAVCIKKEFVNVCCFQFVLLTHIHTQIQIQILFLAFSFPSKWACACKCVCVRVFFFRFHFVRFYSLLCWHSLGFALLLSDSKCENAISKIWYTVYLDMLYSYWKPGAHG